MKIPSTKALLGKLVAFVSTTDADRARTFYRSDKPVTHRASARLVHGSMGTLVPAPCSMISATSRHKSSRQRSA